MSRRILIILGQPSTNSLCAALASTYADAARHAGAEVRLLELGEMQLTPSCATDTSIASRWRPTCKALSSTLPGRNTWCGSIRYGGADYRPLLKGFLDRIFLPGFAFKYRANSALWDRLLAGRTAELLVTMDFLLGTTAGYNANQVTIGK
jgi:putative NADPH-quinone reductase